MDNENAVFKYAKKIFGFAYSKTHNSYDAEDLSQEILYQILNKQTDFSDIENMDAYVYRICCYTWSNYFRKNKPAWNMLNFSQQLISSVPSDENIEKELIDSELFDKLRQEIMYLSRTRRDITIMYYYENKSGDEIAKILNDMRIENQSNSEIFEKLLTGINNKIEVLSVDNETADLLKLYVAELKKITEDNIANSSVKFDSLNSSITKILDVNSELAKNADVNEAFLNLSSNINELSRSFEDQRGKLLKLDDELSKVNSSFLNKDELSLLIANFSDNLQSINLNMKNSYGQIIKSLENTDNYLKSFDYSNQIINLSNQIDNVLSDVRDIPNKISFENLENKISYYQELLDSLRAVVDQISSDARLNIEKKFENIENLFKSIVTDSDFLEFKSNLADFIQKIIDNSSSLNIELNNNKKQIEKIIETLNILNFNDDFNNVVNTIDNLKADFLQGASINYENLSSEISGLEQSLNSSFENLGNSYKELYSDIKLEVTEILLNLKKVIELNPKNSIDELSSILTDALEDIHSIKQVIPNSFVDDINENANNNYEAVKEYIVELDASINKLKSTFFKVLFNFTKYFC